MLGFPYGNDRRFAATRLSGFNQNRCPVFVGIRVQFDSEYAPQRLDRLILVVVATYFLVCIIGLHIEHKGLDSRFSNSVVGTADTVLGNRGSGGAWDEVVAAMISKPL